MKLIAIDEMRHAEMFAERVKKLGGEPVTEHGAKVQKGQKVEAMFSFDAKLEDNSIDVYNYFDNVDEHISDLGGTCLAKLAGTPSSTGLTPKGFAVGAGGA